MKIKNLTVDWVVTDPATDTPVNFSLDIETSEKDFPHDFARVRALIGQILEADAALNFAGGNNLAEDKE